MTTEETKPAPSAPPMVSVSVGATKNYEQVVLVVEVSHEDRPFRIEVNYDPVEAAQIAMRLVQSADAVKRKKQTGLVLPPHAQGKALIR